MPVVLGIMRFTGFWSLQRMTVLCKPRLPEGMMEDTEKKNTSHEAFKAWGIELAWKRAGSASMEERLACIHTRSVLD